MLGEMRRDLGRVDASQGKLTLRELVTRFKATIASQAKDTVSLKNTIVDRLLSDFAPGANIQVAKIIASFKEASKELVLDFDATDDRVHGNQEGRHFHGYHGDWCFLPLYLFCGEQLMVAYFFSTFQPKISAKRLRTFPAQEPIICCSFPLSVIFMSFITT